MLEKDGFHVTLAKDGKEAVEIFERQGNTFDLVLLDWSMPFMGGKETFRRLQAIEPEVKVVFTSGYGPFDSDANPEIHFIQKPFQTSALIEAVHRVLSFS
jgi:CheY-like chemotaxis protein